MVARSFQINVPQSVLDDLRGRLERTRWPDEVEGAGWDYGSNLAYMQELADYWRDRFDWRAAEEKLNAFPQFRADVDGQSIHFVHVRGTGPDPMPIVLTHGWPDSFYRYAKVIPMLSDPARFGGDPADSFDVVVPSLPGFGFSDRPHERGMTSARIADLWATLMKDVLGYERYAAAGGDVGSGVSQYLALRHPESVVGIHVTDIGFYFLNAGQPDLTDAERQFVQSIQQWWMQEGAYAMLQSTKPETAAYGLNDSPVGLAAWLVEKFRSWSDSGGDVERRFTKDELLTFVTIYWVTRTIGSSFRLYYEDLHAPPAIQPGQKIPVPAAVAQFRDLPVPLPREYAERSLDVRRYTLMDKGGHFAAFEEPELYAKDVTAFMREFRGEMARGRESGRGTAEAGGQPAVGNTRG